MTQKEEDQAIAEKHGFSAIIPGKNKDVPIHHTKGKNKERMKKHLPDEYKRRPIVETVCS